MSYIVQALSELVLPDNATTRCGTATLAGIRRKRVLEVCTSVLKVRYCNVLDALAKLWGGPALHAPVQHAL